MNKTKEVVIFAKAVFIIPADWKVDIGWEGKPIGFITPDNESVHPAIGIDVDGVTVMTDDGLAKYGVQCIAYLDEETGVEE